MNKNYRLTKRGKIVCNVVNLVGTICMAGIFSFFIIEGILGV